MFDLANFYNAVNKSFLMNDDSEQSFSLGI